MNLRDLKIFFRVLFKARVLSIINLTGLSLGIAASLFITLFVDEELSYDTQHKNIDCIFRVTTEFVSESSIDHTALSSSPLASELKYNYEEVKEAVRFLESRDATLQYENNVYKEKNIYKADPGVFTVFTHKFLRGNAAHALAGPDRAVLTSSIAKKYFGTEDPLGKSLIVNASNYVVTGIIEDLQPNSDLQFDVLLSIEESDFDGWFDFSYYTYVLFHESVLRDKQFQRNFEHKINKLTDDKINRPLRENQQPITATLHIQPLRGLHFEEALLYDTAKGNKAHIYLFSLAATFLLLIACLNYINFSIVQSLRRSVEVGIRKVMGATRHQLRRRYIGESVFITFLTILVAFSIVVLLLPVLNSVSGKTFAASDLFTLKTLTFSLIILLAAGILAGSYSAFYVTSFSPVSALRGKIGTPKGQIIRNLSITAQFMISLGLIICTGIIYRQMTFVQNYDLGFKQNNIIIINVPADSINNHNVRFLTDRLRQNSSVQNLTLCGMGALPGGNTERGSVTLVTAGKHSVKMINYSFIDENYLPFLNISVKEGRNFIAAESEAKNSVIVNEALVRLMGWKDPLQQRIISHGKDRQVIGVLRDFNYKSLHHKIEPQVLFYNDDKNMHVLVSLSKQMPVSEQVQLLDSTWRMIFRNEPFVYNFLDESLATQYANEEKAVHVFTGFSILSIVISCLGLFGLSALTTYQRRKEIGIRKVLGAGFSSLILLFYKQYIGLVVLSFGLISPITWIVMSRWLENFTYRHPIEISFYVMVAVATVLVCMIITMASSTKLINSNTVKLIGD